MDELAKVNINGKEYHLKDETARQGSGGNADLTGVVKSVNGQTPDENGNVEISVSGGGLSATASALLINILRNAVYTTDQSANITALENALFNGGTAPDVPDVPDVPVVTKYTIVSALLHATSNNASATVESGASYTATITAEDGYTLDGATVSVSMGGVDITATAYANGVVTIASVTGNVIITVNAVEQVASDILYQLASPVTFTGTEEAIDTKTKINAENIDYTVCFKINCDKQANYPVTDAYSAGFTLRIRDAYYKMFAFYVAGAEIDMVDDWRLNGKSEHVFVVTHNSASGEYIARMVYPTQAGRESNSPYTGTKILEHKVVNETMKIGCVGFVGTFDDFVIYNRVLTDDEINAYLGVA